MSSDQANNLITESHLTTFATNLLEANSVPAEFSIMVAKSLVDSDLRGVPWRNASAFIPCSNPSWEDTT